MAFAKEIEKASSGLLGLALLVEPLLALVLGHGLVQKLLSLRVDLGKLPECLVADEANLVAVLEKKSK